MDIPVAFLLYNRPEKTAQPFETIRLARLSILYFIADGQNDDKHSISVTVASNLTEPAHVSAMQVPGKWREMLLRNPGKLNTLEVKRLLRRDERQSQCGDMHPSYAVLHTLISTLLNLKQPAAL